MRRRWRICFAYAPIVIELSTGAWRWASFNMNSTGRLNSGQSIHPSKNRCCLNSVHGTWALISKDRLVAMALDAQEHNGLLMPPLALLLNHPHVPCCHSESSAGHCLSLWLGFFCIFSWAVCGIESQWIKYAAITDTWRDIGRENTPASSAGDDCVVSHCDGGRH